MLTGLMDHWVPSHPAISGFWKTPFDELAPVMAKLCDEVAINNFTFYTKWMSNGVHSKLPFLNNDPHAQNTITDNRWGRQWIDFFHQRGMTVGAMLQCYGFEFNSLPREAVLRQWVGTNRCTDYAHDDEMADPLWPGYGALLEAMLEEQLRLFPGLDAVFLEFEGLGGPPGDRPLHRLAKGAQVPAAVREQWRASGWPVAEQEHWIWTPGVQAALAEALREHLAVAHRVMHRVGYKGIRGVVYHAMNYETPYIESVLPDRTWWHLPWQYWGWGDMPTGEGNTARRQIDWCIDRWRRQTREGQHICYIGNATLPTTMPESIEELAHACIDMGAPGYLGMGNPIPDIGLRWHDQTQKQVAEARDIYRRLFPPKQPLAV